MHIAIRPVPVIIVSLMYILAGGIGFVYHFGELFNPIEEMIELVLVLLLRITAVACGILLFLGFKWARWLAIAWMGYHVVLSTFHPVSELIAHIVILAIVALLLFLPVSDRFFKKRTAI
jgi:hypothetical protein